MKIVSIQNSTRSQRLCSHCEVADNMLTRMKGLLGRQTLDQNEGLLIVPCNSIHMWGMKFPLDVIFLTRQNIVTDFIENIPPGKCYLSKKHHGKAYAALEVAAGTAKRTNLQHGDQLEIDDEPRA